MPTVGRTRPKPALALGAALVALTLLIVTGLALREYGPGDMGAGFLWGAAASLAGAGVMAWRVSRRPGSATTFERAWTRTGDERDDALLTRSLAVLGLLAVPLTGVAAIAIGLGARAEMVLTLLLVAEIAVGAVAFAVVDRRS
ncbi:hypothetical protein GCU56_01220 [Geodermatophilus sabuli]|uniref:Uncharacterized protein n=1 Tax=Geodermatophilus sabuli TaxID=1564158 RepID=A0A7K3VV40_9ACTN|nr:hypothetical protein [Geodermatophilus sabuli]NEK56496.1 hypothetical protein [Geodermatophilus sabuli]